MGMELVPITPENALVFKMVRLRALKTDPTAFGSTHANESLLNDEAWIQRVRDWGSTRVGFLAMNGELRCGMAAAFPDPDDTACAQLVSMWVAPECRRIGVGRVLIDAIKSWAAVHNLRELRLFVTSMNQGAIDFYIRNGFAMTGRTEPYPNDPMLVEFEMTISIKRN